MGHHAFSGPRGVAALCAAALLAGAGAQPALAADRIVTVSGDSVTSDCAAAKSPSTAIALTGNLVGCLAIFVEHFNCRELNGFAHSIELGREEFEGTLDGAAITFDTSYTFDAVWPSGSCPAPAPTAEISGYCIHYVSGEGVQGVIRFFDVIPTAGNGATNYFYEGSLTVSDGGTAAIAPLVPPSIDVAAAETPPTRGIARPPVASC